MVVHGKKDTVSMFTFLSRFEKCPFVKFPHISGSESFQRYQFSFIHADQSLQQF